MDDPNIMMEEYIQLMADKARGDFEIDFTAIVYNDASTSNQNVCSEPTEQYGVSYGLGYGVLIPDLAETMIWYMLKRHVLNLSGHAEALV
ncbi:hypothetical protein Tco_1545577, partial [Tanacetum coccineum]